MRKNIFSLKAWHFCLLCVCLMTLTFILNWLELKNFPEEFDSCFVEMNDAGLTDTSEVDLCCVLFHDGESVLDRKMEYNVSELATVHLLGANYYKVNVSDNAQMCADYHISGVPSLLVLKNGEEMNRVIGVVSSSNLRKIFNKIAP